MLSQLSLAGLLCLALSCLLVTTVAHASGSSLLDVLHNNKVITDTQYRQLKRERKQQQQHDKQQARAAQAVTPATPPKSAEKKAALDLLPDRIYGFFQFDVPLSVGSGNTLGTRTVLRRFYLYVRDQVAPHWSYATALGYNNGSTYFDYGYVTYDGLHIGHHPLAISGGYFKVPGTLAYPTSPKNLLFMEYALPIQALKPGKSIGLKVATHGTRWSLATGATQGSYSQKAEPGVAGRWGMTLRGTWVPWMTKNALWEIGANAAWREADSNHKARFSDRPEAYVVGTKLVDTGAIGNVSWFSLAGAETLLQAGPFSLQAEYLLKEINRDSAPHLNFSGWYVQTTWSLTGEKRPFNPATGKLGSLNPQHTLANGGWGAWELATRYSTLDLNSADINGGFERNVSVGINWFPVKPVKLMLNAIRVLPLDGGPFPGQSTTIVMMRLQAKF
ncbi:MAG: OprO/OprP family phosphate-selective porin [Sinobacteraceae bacterium]|nr:OprO/OprP family phosphate-selective porin [Nevskiaceae bacterium]